MAPPDETAGSASAPSRTGQAGAGAPLVVLTTAPDRETAERIARALVERSLAACVNLVPGVRSLYRWKGKIEEADEVLLVVKTTAARIRELERALGEIHPYDVPEFIAFEPATVGAEYLAWLVQETAPPRAHRG
jgi:periplasmic divalent cation tolerance protein